MNFLIKIILMFIKTSDYALYKQIAYDFILDVSFSLNSIAKVIF